ncbi:MAG: DUF4255 domain-containing protein [Chloroflexi bacterium]|nr:DUF4255 domain-containing protein [Chloroflexota bacterium]
MIELFDETLRDLIRREVTNGSQVEIAFDAPTKEWAGRRNTPTLDVYLYDIRDDLERREAAWDELRDKTGRVTERRPPPRRIRLSYLVTAWTQRPEDEHRLLSACLASFLRHEALGPRELTGALADQPHAVELTVAAPPGADRSIVDVWTALGGELKPSLDLVASVPFVVDLHKVAGPPVLETPRLRVAGDEARPGAAPPRGKAASGLNATEAVPEETRAGGAGDHPGRILRVRGRRDRR